MEINNYIQSYLKQTQKAASLAAFRICFSLLMLYSLTRFLIKGWVDLLYIQPAFHFKYYGFEWVRDLGVYNYGLFAIAIISCLAILVGFYYRIAIICFFLSFTYIELIDKTTYLNHYYFISLLAFIMMFMPMNASFSWDVIRKQKTYKYVPKYYSDGLKLLLGIVYFYAGVSKLNSDWLLRAQPLRIWLSNKTSLPIIGNLMNDSWFHYTMSWSGAIYDLSIPFLLLYKRTRLLAYVCVIFFHVFTSVLFPIGVFPFVMIATTLIFFDEELHEKFITFLKKWFVKKNHKPELKQVFKPRYPKLSIPFFTFFFLFQLIFPFRYLCYPGELFWTEEGYRFSWRVMLIEKVGYLKLKIVDNETGEYFTVENDKFLSPFQIKEMKTQPDFILEYVKIIGDYYTTVDRKDISIFAESYVALNGRLAQPYIDPKIDLYKLKEGFEHKNWILPLKDEIKGF